MAAGRRGARAVSARLRLVAAGVGLGLLVWAAASLAGSSAGRPISPVSVAFLALALLSAILPRTGGWRELAGATALVLAVQSLALELAASGTWAMGWRPLPTLLGERRLALAGLAAATLAGPLLLPEARRKIRRLLAAARPGLRREAALALVLAVGLATLYSPFPGGYAVALALTLWVYALANWLLLALGVSLPGTASRRLLAWLGPLATAGSGVARRLPWLLAGWTFAASAVIALVVFEAVPHVPDEITYWFQARTLAMGRLFAPAPPVADAFALPYVLNDGVRWYGIFPPGWPALLALGLRLGAPWLVNPLLGAGAVLLTHALVSVLYSRRTAHLAAGLLAASPMFLFLCASTMSHPFTLVCALAALLGFNRAAVRGLPAPAIGGGLALGALMLTRPVEGVVVGLVLFVYAVAAHRAAGLRTVVLLGTVAAAVGSLLLPYHRVLTGDALYDPITKYFDETFYAGSNRLGFGPDIANFGWQNDLLPGHSPLEAAFNANRNSHLLSLELLGWSAGSLGLALYLGLSRCWRRPDALFAGLVATTIGAYSLFWYSGADLGARYWSQALIPLVVLTARGLEALAGRLRAEGAGVDLGARLAAPVLVLTLAALALVVPWRALGKYHRYRGMSADVVRLARDHDFEGGLVLVRGAGPGRPFWTYASSGFLNRVTLEGPEAIYAREGGAAGRRALERAFPGRPVWVLEQPADASGRVRLVEPPAQRPPAVVRRP